VRYGTGSAGIDAGGLDNGVIIVGTVLRSSGKYRLRTWLRKHLPYLLSDRIPKGAQDCGDHEWYRQDEEWDACYHCVVGRRPHEPISEEAPRGEFGQPVSA
jgi:hypothetical protein